jgi:hypothetical protein
VSIGPQRPSDAQLSRRRWKAVEYANAGYSAIQSATALGVATGTINADRALMRRYITTSGRGRHNLPDPPSYDWVSEPPPLFGEPARWRNSPAARLAGVLHGLRSENTISRTAHYLAEAKAEGDEKWYAGYQIALADLMAYLARLDEVLASEDAREEAATLAGRDDLKGLHTSRAGIGSRPMPPPGGGGAMPGRVFADLWRYWHAGYPLDDRTLRRVARAQNVPLARVERAREQFEDVYGQPARTLLKTGGETE